MTKPTNTPEDLRPIGTEYSYERWGHNDSAVEHGKRFCSTWRVVAHRTVLPLGEGGPVVWSEEVELVSCEEIPATGREIWEHLLLAPSAWEERALQAERELAALRVERTP